jgi:hygromycin-B 7''-O-kinase
MALPRSDSDQGWNALLADDNALQAGVTTILQRHGQAGATPRRYDSGSQPVYALGTQQVLKLYPPRDAEHAVVEAAVLAHVDGALPIATPQLLARGTLDGWSYLLMSQLPGQRLVDVWPQLQPHERDAIAETLGAAVAALHALDVSPLQSLPGPQWAAFVAEQRASAVERQRRRGLAPHWLEQIEPFLERWAAPPSSRCVLLHTEIMREHLLVEPFGDGWRLSGLFDFEPAMLGEADYEFASIGLFVSCGDAGLLRRMLRASGRPAAALDATLPMRFMTHALLHRYSHLGWYLRRLPLPQASTLEQLAQQWFGVDEAN